LHLLSAAVVVRNGHVFPWLFFVLVCPFLGCLIYFAVMMGPELREDAARAVRFSRKLADPRRDLRLKRRQAEMVGSADTKRALAEECLKRGSFDEAVALFETAAMGVHANDPALLHGLAQARFLNNDPAGAQQALDHLRAANSDWGSPKAHLLYARTLEQQGKWQDALAEYEALTGYHSGEEARCRLALLLKKHGRTDEARALFETVLQATDRVPKRHRRTRRAWEKVARRHLVG
jgi:hypothetical protein